VSRFPAAFRPPALACRVILFPPGDWAFLTVGLPGALRPDPDGVSTFRTARYDRGGCPLYPGDGGALPARCRARPSPAASQRPVPAPRTRIPPAGLRFTRHQRGFTRFTRPACPSPVTTRMGPAVLGLSPVLRTPPLPATHDRAGPGVSTRPELRGRHNRPSNPRVHSRSATSCRNGRTGRSLGSALVNRYTDAAGLGRRGADDSDQSEERWQARTEPPLWRQSWLADVAVHAAPNSCYVARKRW